MEKAIFQYSLPNEDRFDLVSEFLNNEMVSLKDIKDLLSDNYSPIRCEALDYIISKGKIKSNIQEIVNLFNNDSELYIKGRALCAIAIAKKNGINVNYEINILDDESYSIWIELYNIILFDDDLSLFRLVTYKFSKNKSISSLASNIVKDFNKYLDIKKISIAENILSNW